MPCSCLREAERRLADRFMQNPLDVIIYAIKKRKDSCLWHNILQCKSHLSKDIQVIVKAGLAVRKESRQREEIRYIFHFRIAPPLGINLDLALSTRASISFPEPSLPWTRVKRALGTRLHARAHFPILACARTFYLPVTTNNQSQLCKFFVP